MKNMKTKDRSHLRDHESGLFETSNSFGLTMILKGNNIIQAAGIYSTEIFQGQRFLTGGLLLNGRSQISKKLLTDLLASFTYVPGTVIQLGYGSLYDRIEWRQDRYVESDRFLETRRGLFFKISYLWRL